MSLTRPSPILALASPPSNKRRSTLGSICWFHGRLDPPRLNCRNSYFCHAVFISLLSPLPWLLPGNVHSKHARFLTVRHVRERQVLSVCLSDWIGLGEAQRGGFWPLEWGTRLLGAETGRQPPGESYPETSSKITAEQGAGQPRQCYHVFNKFLWI